MADKEIRVVIDGKETVSAASKQAESSVESFASKAKDFLAPLAALGIGAALGGFFKKAIDESLEGVQSMERMKQAVLSSGESFQQMRPQIDATISNLTRLTTYTDDQLMASFSDMVTMTGDAKGSLANVGLAADLAAAKSIPLEAATTAIGKAMAGNTTALAKLVPELKGSSDIMGDLKLKVDGTAAAMGQTMAGSIERAKNQFSEFAQAVGDAILNSDGLTGSGDLLVDTLASMAQWVTDNRAEIGKFVDVLVTVSENIGQALIPAFQFLWTIAKPIIIGLSGIIAEASFAIRSFAIYAKDSAGKFVASVADMADKGASVLRAFGINVGTALVGTIRDAGSAMQTEAAASWSQLEKDHGAFWTRIKTFGDGAVQTVKEQETLKTGAVSAALKEQEQVTKDTIANLKAWYKILDEQVVSYKDTVKTLAPAIKEAMDTRAIQGQQLALDASKEAADKAFAAIKLHGTLPPLIKPVESAVLGVRDGLLDAATSALDVVDKFGGMDDNAKAVLESCIKVVGQLDSMATKGLTFGGVAGVIGGVASIVQMMMASDKERQNLLRQNNERLSELSDGIGNLDLNLSGGDMTKGADALEAIMPFVNDPLKFDKILEILGQKGVTLGDLKRMADELGIKITGKDGMIDPSLLPQLLAAIKATGPAQVGKSFGDQLSFFKESQRLSGSSGITRFSDLATFATNIGQTSLLDGIDWANPTRARSQLFGLLTQLNNGGIPQASLGNFTGGQFRSLITEMIDGIDASVSSSGSSGGAGGASDTGAGSTTGTGTGSGATGGTGNTPTGPAPKTLDDVLTGITAQTDALAEYHTAHLSIARDHLTESRIHTELLGAIVANTAGMGGSSDTAFGKQILVERRLAGAAGL